MEQYSDAGWGWPHELGHQMEGGNADGAHRGRLWFRRAGDVDVITGVVNHTNKQTIACCVLRVSFAMCCVFYIRACPCVKTQVITNFWHCYYW